MLHIKTTRKPTNQKITPKPNKRFPSPPNKTPTPRKGQLIIKNTWRQEELWNKASFPHYITFPIKYCHLFPFSRQRYHDFLNSSSSYKYKSIMKMSGGSSTTQDHIWPWHVLSPRREFHLNASRGTVTIFGMIVNTLFLKLGPFGVYLPWQS